MSKKYFYKKSFKTAFSLVELSIVVLIIGILIAGISQSSRLVRAMKLTTARSLTRSSDVNSIRNLTAWFDATAEGVMSTALPLTANATYTSPENRDNVMVWKDSNPQDAEADKVVLYNNNTANSPMYLANGIGGLPSLYFDNADILVSNNLVTMPLQAGSRNYSMFVVFNYDRTAVDSEATACNISGIFSIGNGNGGGAGDLIKVDTWDSRYIAVDFSNTTNFAQTWFQFNKSIKNETNYAFGFSADLNYNYTELACPSGSQCNKVNAYLNSTSPITRRNTGNSSSPPAASVGFFGIGGDVSNTTTSVNLYGTATNIYNGSPANYNSGCGGFKGLISEVIVFDRTLTNEESSSVMAYLIKKYNLKSV